MNEDVRIFLSKFNAEELVSNGALSRHASTEHQLNHRNLEPLIQLMEEHNIARLEATERNWYLTSDREFSNPSEGEVKLVSCRTCPRLVLSSISRTRK